jgi:hypothetical protein
VDSDYARSTTSTTLAGLPPAIRDALTTHAEARLLTVGADAPAYLTHSTRLRKRLFGGDKDREHFTAFALGPRDLLVCTHGEQRGTSVLSARLEDVAIEELSLAPAGDGMSVSGFATSTEGQARVASYYVGLGAPDGDAAREALRDAVRAARAA